RIVTYHVWSATSVLLFFFFQAEDGIRDRNVTGVQTCALPIWCRQIYPLAIPIDNAKLPTPGTLKSGRMIGSNRTPINLTTPKLINNSAMMKNGSKEGKT